MPPCAHDSSLNCSAWCSWCGKGGSSRAPINIPAEHGVHNKERNLRELEQHDEEGDFAISLPTFEPDVEKHAKNHLLSGGRGIRQLGQACVPLSFALQIVDWSPFMQRQHTSLTRLHCVLPPDQVRQHGVVVRIPWLAWNRECAAC